MTHPNREQLWLLIINAIDNLEKIEKASELTDIIWEINISNNSVEKNWRRTEVLLESYEQTRDRSLNEALSNLRELVDMMTC